MPRFSLICGTAGRVGELDRMLLALAGQSFQDFELLLIDQNSDERVLGIMESLPQPLQQRIERLLAPPGLCRALNLGLQKAQGEIVAFPDDDCWYPPDLLQSVSDLLNANRDWGGLTIPTADELGVPSIVRWAKRPARLTASNLGMRGCSTSVFYCRRVCAQVGFFDETIGGGLVSPGSDMDYLHRVVSAGFHIQYQPQLLIHHPQTLPLGDDAAARQKQYTYAYGEGAIPRKYSVALWYSAGILVLPLARAAKYAVLGKRAAAASEWVRFRGRLDGWLRTRPVR